MQATLNYLLIISLILCCMYAMLVNYSKGKLFKKDSGDLSELVNLQSTKIIVSQEESGLNLSFDSIQDFINSSPYLLDVDTIRYTKSTLLDNKNNILAYSYISEDGVISITTDKLGKITCCKVKDTASSSKVMELMHSKLNKTPYSYKVTSDGYVLEPSCTF